MADEIKLTLDRDTGRRASLFTGMTGREGDVSGKTDGNAVADQLMAAYGITERGGINTKAAAADLGVSQRSVQRWIARDAQRRSTPRADRLKQIATKARQAATTAKGRRAAMRSVRASKRGKRMATAGAQVSINGRQGPQSAGKKYMRQRTVTVDLSAADVNAMWSAYERGGEKALSQWLTDNPGNDYLEDWQFETIDDLNMRPR